MSWIPRTEPQPNTKPQGCIPLLLEQGPRRTFDPVLASGGGGEREEGKEGKREEEGREICRSPGERFAVPGKMVDTALSFSSPLS